jgi:hypothetical protein
MVWFTVQAKTTLVEHISTTINEDPTFTSFFKEKVGIKAFLAIFALKKDLEPDPDPYL